MSQKYIYIILVIVFAVFAVMIIRDWLVQRKQQTAGPGQTNGSHTADDRAITLPLQLQAYERLVLLLERIKPAQLIMRMNEPVASVRDMRYLLIQHINAEFEHNLSQQIYVSNAAWEAVCNAKEQVNSLINALAEGIPAAADGYLLNKKLLELSLKENEFPIHTALQIINTEAKKLLH